MSSDPPNRFNRPGGGKLYRHPLTGEEFDSVTSALEMWDKDGLKIWAGMLAADAAFELMPALVGSVLEPECGNTFNRCYQKHGQQATCERCPCGVCERCLHRRLAWRHSLESSRRSQEGTECHAAINHWVLSGGDRTVMRDEVAPYFATFLQWVHDFGLVPGAGPDASWVQTETTLLNRQHRYAGTSDAAVIIRRKTPKAAEFLQALNIALGGVVPLREALVRIDWKTREKPDPSLHLDMPLQGEAYERCDTAMLPDGTEHPAPKTLLRCVLQLRPLTLPDGTANPNPYSFEPMTSGDQVFEQFLGLLGAFRWATEQGGDAKKAFGWGARFDRPEPAVAVRSPVAEPANTVDVDLPLWDLEREAADPGYLEDEFVVQGGKPEDLDPWGPWPAEEHAAQIPTATIPFDPPYQQVSAPAPEPKKAPARKPAAKKTAPAAPSGGSNTADLIKSYGQRWPVGQPAQHLFDEQIPF